MGAVLNGPLRRIVFLTLLVGAFFSFQARAQTADQVILDDEEAAELIEELKEGLPDLIEDEGKVKAIEQKWAARKSLGDRTRADILELLFEDVKAVIQDEGTRDKVWDEWNTSSDEEIPEETPAPAKPEPERPQTPVQKGNTQLPRVEDVIERYTEAMGGFDAFNRIRTVKMTGTATIGAEDLSVSIFKIVNKAYRSEFSVGGLEEWRNDNWYYDGKAWSLHRVAGDLRPRELSSSERENLASASRAVSDLMDHRNQGHQVELLGIVSIDGSPSYKILLTTKTGRVRFYYIRVSDSMPVREEQSYTSNGAEVTRTWDFSNFVKINGAVFAKTITETGPRDITTHLQSIEINIPIDEGVFKPPVESKSDPGPKAISQSVDDLIAALGAGNSTRLAMSFDTYIGLLIGERSDNYGRAEAEKMIRDFFARQGVTGFELKRRGESGSTLIFTGILKTRQGNFNTHVFLQPTKNGDLVKEIRIMPAN